MLVERRLVSSEDDRQDDYTFSQKSKDIGRVASATLFNTQFLLPPGQAKVNGDGHFIHDSYDLRTLIQENSKTGELEVRRQHSAFIAGFLEGHMEVREVHVREGREPPSRTFVFIDINGRDYHNMSLLDVHPRRRERRLEHTAVFVHPPETANQSRSGIEIIAIDDICDISYTPQELDE